MASRVQIYTDPLQHALIASLVVAPLVRPAGPLVFATDLIDGFKTSETVKLPEEPQAGWLTLLPREEGEPPVLRLDPGYRTPLRFTPYFSTGGRHDGAWRLTWLPLAPENSL